MRAIDIPLVQGLREDIDPKLLPVGGLTRVENARRVRGGRYVKRHGVTVVDLTGGPSSGATQFVGHLAGGRVIGGGGLFWADEAADTDWQLVGRQSTCTPVRRWDAFNGYGLDEGMDLGIVNGYLIVAVCGLRTSSSSNALYVKIYDLETRTQVTNAVYAAKSYTFPRVVPVPGQDRCVVIARDTTDIDAISIDLSSGAPSSLGPLTTLANWSAGAGYNACAGTGDNFYIIYKDAANDWTIELYDWLLGLVQSDTYNPGVATGGELSIFANDNGGAGNVFVIWASATTTLSCVVYDSVSVATAGKSATTTIVSGPTPHGFHGFARRDNTSLWMAMRHYDGTDAATYLYSVTNTPSALLQESTGNVHPVSAPFVASVDRVACWSADWNGALIRHHRVFFAGDDVTQLWDDSNALDLIQTEFASVAQADDGRYLTVAPVIIDGLGASTPSMAARVYEWRVASDGPKHAVRRLLDLGDVGIIAGGAPQQYDGRLTADIGWTQYPALSGVKAAGGSLDASAAYQYVVLWEWTDQAVRLHQSPPSEPITVSTDGAGNESVDLTLRFPSCIPNTQGAPAYLRVFRTEGGGSIFYELPPVVTHGLVIQGSLYSATFNDATADAALVGNRPLPAQQGLVDKFGPPSCQTMAVVGDRLWCAGLFECDVVHASAPQTGGEAWSWPQSIDNKVRVPGVVTGIAGLDETPVVFTRDAIYVVQGTGPDLLGIGSFLPPRRIPSPVGCIDWRSVISTPAGVFFQSIQGLYLLPRGFGSPEFVGAAVRDTLEAYPAILGCELIERRDNVTVRWLCADDGEAPTDVVVLVYDLGDGQWSVDDYAWTDVSVIGVDRQQSETSAIFARDSLADPVPVLLEAVNHNINTTTMVLETGDVRASGLSGYNRASYLRLLAEYRAACTVTIDVSTDAGKTFTTPKAFTVSGHSVGDQIELSYQLRNQKSDSYRFRVQVSDAGEGVALNGLALWLMKLPGPKPLHPGVRL